MNGDPTDPISFEQALRMLWDQLAASAGLNLQAFLGGTEGGASNYVADAKAKGRKQEEHLQSLRTTAHERLLGLIIVGELRAWTADAETWKRPTERTVRERLLHAAADEPVGLYVDRQELGSVVTQRWPTDFPSDATSAVSSLAGRTPRKGKPGRPTGAGTYAEDDAPLLIEMNELLKTRRALSVHAAAKMVAERARGGGTPDSKARRLTDGYRAWSMKESSSD